jgi:hypothetical protein
MASPSKATAHTIKIQRLPFTDYPIRPIYKHIPDLAFQKKF